MIFTKRSFLLAIRASRSLLTAFFDGIARLPTPLSRKARRHFLIVFGALSSFPQIDFIVRPSPRPKRATARSHLLLLLDERHARKTLRSSDERDNAHRVTRGFGSRLAERQCAYRFVNCE